VQIHGDVRLRTCLQLGSSHLHTYSVAYLREVKNCDGKFQNTRILMSFLQLWKIVIAWSKIIFFNGPGAFLTRLSCSQLR
jgi:hypothetical protein